MKLIYYYYYYTKTLVNVYAELIKIEKDTTFYQNLCVIIV